jgi:4-hydroxy-tetrahydrodipicolinate synthase
MSNNELGSVLTPVTTPFNPDLSPDFKMLEKHCRWLLSEGSGLAIFGTNSEGNSLSVEEKIDLLDRLVDAGLPAARMMPGTGSCALPDAVRLSKRATERGCGGVLMLPPFYYKSPPEEGLYRFVAEVIDRVGNDALRIYLYHIPPVAQVGFSLDLIERLIKAFPKVVVGIKDSSGDFAHTRQLLARFPGWGTYCGNEINLVEAMGLGAVGCISATCNVNAGRIVTLSESWDKEGADALQAEINALRAAVTTLPMIPALKSLAGRFHGSESFRIVRPPLTTLAPQQEAALFAAADAHDFSMRPRAA